MIYAALYAPKATHELDRRRELTLNVLLSCLSLLFTLRILATFLDSLKLQIDQHESWLLVHGIYLLATLSLWRLSRRGAWRLASLGLVIMLSILALHLTLHWGFELPLCELLYAIIIMIAGVLLPLRWALIVTAVIAGLLLGISYGQSAHHMQPRIDWLRDDFSMTDAVMYVIILSFVMLTSWMSNRQINRWLQLAQDAEASLKAERDSLERQVQHRTQQLETTQLLRAMEHQHLAEFGRLSANLLHEIANPLTAISFSLDGFQEDGDSELIAQAQRSVAQLHDYMRSARAQLQQTATLGPFVVSDELDRTVRMMQPQASKVGLQIELESKTTSKIYGDSIKFNQTIANLLSNAIEAYAGVDRPPAQRVIKVRTHLRGQYLKIEVHDWGKGITDQQLPRLFGTFYTTKNTSKGLGLGLANVKQIVETDFGGTIKAQSSKRRGTTFIIRLPYDDRLQQ